MADPRTDPLSLGNLLMEAGLVTRAELDEAIRYQQENVDVMLGEALIQLGVIDRSQLEMYLAHQRGRRNGNPIKEVAQLAVAKQRKLGDTLDRAVESVKRFEARLEAKIAAK